MSTVKVVIEGLGREGEKWCIPFGLEIHIEPITAYHVRNDILSSVFTRISWADCLILNNVAYYSCLRL